MQLLWGLHFSPMFLEGGTWFVRQAWARVRAESWNVSPGQETVSTWLCLQRLDQAVAPPGREPYHIHQWW